MIPVDAFAPQASAIKATKKIPNPLRPDLEMPRTNEANKAKNVTDIYQV